MIDIIIEILKKHTREMSNSHFHGSEPGISEDDYDDVAEDIYHAIKYHHSEKDCEECEGTGKRSFYENDYLVDCVDCGGTGKDFAFPTSEEAKVILAEEGIDTTELKSWASGKLAEIKAKHGIQEVAG